MQQSTYVYNMFCRTNKTGFYQLLFEQPTFFLPQNGNTANTAPVVLSVPQGSISVVSFSGNSTAAFVNGFIAVTEITHLTNVSTALAAANISISAVVNHFTHTAPTVCLQHIFIQD